MNNHSSNFGVTVCQKSLEPQQRMITNIKKQYSKLIWIGVLPNIWYTKKNTNHLPHLNILSPTIGWRKSAKKSGPAPDTCALRHRKAKGLRRTSTQRPDPQLLRYAAFRKETLSAWLIYGCVCVYIYINI